MGRAAWWAGLLALLAGCGPTVGERLRTYNDDAMYLFQQGDYPGARECFQAALSLQPENADLLYDVGECYDRSGNAAKAEECYNLCLKRSADHVRCRHALTALLVRTGRRKEATYQVEAWLAKDPKKPDPYAEDGWLWHQAGDLPQAQARLQQALDLDPHNLRALNELGLVYEHLGLPERAVVLYNRSLALDPRQPDITERVNQLRSRGAGAPKP